MTMLNLFTKLKKYNKGNYRQFSFCYALSVILVSTLTLFMLSPFVQSRLPIGGDSRKMLYMVYAVAVLGCVLFIIYATGLFLRFKSREVGIFMALGTPKRVLAKTLTKEIVLLILKLGIAGIIIGGVIAFVFGKVYEGFVQSATGDSFSLPLTGVIGSFLFVTITVCIVMGMAVRFLKRANLIEILNEERRTEPIKKNVDTKYLVWGIILIAVGLLGGLIIPYIVSTMLKRSLSGFPYIFYVLVFIGLYRVMVYSIAVHKKGRHPQKYYKNLISFGMMKFQGISVVRNMLIVTLLKEQVTKVYVLPTIVAAVLMFVYYTLTLWQNDGTITLNEYPMIAVNVLTCLAVCIYQYVLYRYSLKKAGKVIFEF